MNSEVQDVKLLQILQDPLYTTQSRSNSLLEEWQQSLSKSPAKQKLASTYKEQTILQDIVLRKHYVLNNKILAHTKVTQNMRGRIRSFLMSQTSKQLVMRSTFALSCTYMDLFFQRGGFCSIEECQNLAIGCLILAMKMEEGRFPTISYSKNAFNKEELLAWQKKIATKLSYQLSPPTYITFGEHILAKWIDFSSKCQQKLKQIRYIQQYFNPFVRRFYEQLDHIFMVYKSLQYPLEQLVINLFYLHIRQFQDISDIDIRQFTNQQFCDQFYQDDDFRLLFESFLKTYSEHKSIALNEDQGLFLKHFLVIGPSRQYFSLRQSLEDIRTWDKLQTSFAKSRDRMQFESYAYCKSVMQKLKAQSR